MAKILITDDEKDILEFLVYNLSKEGYEVITASNGYEALEKIKENPDIIILDVLMPVINGYDTLRILRQNENHRNIPVIFLTAKSSESDEVKGLETGADDYIQKPVSVKKLSARIKANLNKYQRQNDLTDNPALISLGSVEINREKYIVIIDGSENNFPKKEFEVLYYLAKNQGRVIDRDTLLTQIWGENIHVSDRTVDVHIRKIREKLGRFSYIIETIKGVGYKLK